MILITLVNDTAPGDSGGDQQGCTRGGGVITSSPPPLSPILVSPARNTNNHRDQAGAGELSSPAILTILRDGEIICKSGRRILKNGQKWQALANNVQILRVPRNKRDQTRH